jgi:TonB family protein
MQPRLSLLAIALAVASAQAASQIGVVPIQLPRAVYPPIAIAARITGDVEVALDILPDGTMASAIVVSGPELLRPAALEAARKATFTCGGCNDGLQPYSILFEFRYSDVFFEPITEEQQPAPVHVSKSQSRVTTLAEAPLVEPYFTSSAVRAVKCAYLWNCGTLWGGMDFYYDRVRSARCVWMWRCGYSLNEFYRQYLRDHEGVGTSDNR